MNALTLSSEEFQIPDLYPADRIFVFNIYDPHYTAVVYGYYPGHGPIFRHAPRAFYFFRNAFDRLMKEPD